MRANRVRLANTLYFFFLDESIVDTLKFIANNNKGLTPEIVLKEMIDLINYIISITSDASLYRYCSTATQQELFYIALNAGYFQRLQTINENQLFSLYLILTQELEYLDILHESTGSIHMHECELENEPYELVVCVYRPRV